MIAEYEEEIRVRLGKNMTMEPKCATPVGIYTHPIEPVSGAGSQGNCYPHAANKSKPQVATIVLTPPTTPRVIAWLAARSSEVLVH